MAINVVVPSFGPSIEEAVLVKWLVGEGEFVQRGIPLFSVETDKTVVDCESTDEGYLHRTVVAEGSPVRIDQIVGVLTAERQDKAERPQVEESDPVAKPVVSVNEQVLPEGIAGSTAQLPQEGQNQPASDGRIRISPRARRIARDTGISIERLSGSGPTGRIIRRDVEAFVSASIGAGPAVARATPNRAARTSKTQDVPLSMMRRTIARRMTESAQDTPVFFATMKIEADPIVALREQLTRVADAGVSLNDIIVKGCALALRRCPRINATFHGDHMRLHDDIDIAVAVSVEDGLLTPILRNADGKGLMEVSAEIRDLAEKARQGKLAQEDYQGGTFTVSNLGMYGVSEFTAIINPPQCAILAVGTIDREVYLDEGAPRERGVMRVTLTADHRAIDGGTAARFLSELKNVLENPAFVML